ncbi:MAG: DUF4160 domain-containing protein [Bauldia sp.]
MPTILRFDGLRVAVYPNHHRPAQVHVVGNGLEAVFDLNCPGGPLALRENFGFAHRQTSRIASRLAAELADLCREWRRIHGDPRGIPQGPRARDGTASTGSDCHRRALRPQVRPHHRQS